jgi:hypothetical protein
MTETQQRFLRAIAQRVPSAQVVEVHLFPPMRQGGVETGVAVVAEDPRTPSPNGTDAVIEDAESVGEAAQTEPAAEAWPTDAAAEHSVADIAAEEPAGVDVEDGAEGSPYAEDVELVHAASQAVEVEAVAQADGAGEAQEADAAEATSTPAPRYTIHTARYRLQLKGVDRGKWDFDVVAEADASLEALDKVVRGVLRRSGEGAEPDRLTTEAFREALEAPLATLER